LLGKRAAAKQAITRKREKLDEVISAVGSACQAKGWSWQVQSRDFTDARYATIRVSRSVNFQEVTGLLEITVSEEGVKVHPQSTSFHKTGLPALFEAAMETLGRLPWLESKPKGKVPTKAPEPALRTILAEILRRFDRIARQLTRRYDDRTTFIINDEYDVQDLLHAVLKGLYDDVRAEEVSPSYAGASSRMDFLLKKEKIVVEAKFASKSLRDKQIGEQLIVDIKRYQSHPDCQMLYCLVYDPGNHLKNPLGLETDLTGKHGALDVRVIVIPH
jgi:hypothetical protein